MRYWHRVFVDVDQAGNAEKGWVERRNADGPLRAWEIKSAPFDTPQEVFDAAMATLDIQGRLL